MEDLRPSVKENYSPADIERALRVILDTPDLLDRLIYEKEKRKTRRKNWSRLSRSSYYNERYALELKAEIDDMLARGVDKEYRYEDYPELKPNTLYLRCNHAKLYLLDELDPDGKYKEAFRKIMISSEPKHKPTGLRLTILKDIEIPIKAVDISTDQKTNRWKERIDHYVDTAKAGDDPLHMKGLSLSAEEQDALKVSFLNLDHVAAIVTATEIKIIMLP